jgi:hypothetical protein
MRRFAAALFFLFAQSLPAASYTSSGSGNWSSSATWGGAGVPGNGDTVTISDSTTVTVSDARIIGTSGDSTTVAISEGNSGALIIANGGYLKVRGNIVFTSPYCSPGCATYLTVQAGGIFEWDASQASSPSTTNYYGSSTSAYSFRTFVTTGTSGNHAIVRSNAGGGNGYFSQYIVGGGYVFTYTDFTRIGTASVQAFGLRPDSLDSYPNESPWDATHNTFINCGQAPSAVSTGLNPDDVFRHNNNVHTGSLSQIFSFTGASNATLTTGIRQIENNVFDADLSNPSGQIDLRGFTITGNYFGSIITPRNTQAGNCASFAGNFYHSPYSAGEMFVAACNVTGNYFMGDHHDQLNYHWLDVGGVAGGITVSGNVLEHTGIFVTENGKFIITNVSPQSGAYSVVSNIILPNIGHKATFALASIMQVTGAPSGVTYTLDHNTVFMGSVAAVTTQEGSNGGGDDLNPANQITSFRNNLLWSDLTAGNGPTYKLFAMQPGGLGVCAACDYNASTNAKTDGGGYSGGANGYSDVFISSTPGTHDINNLNPLMVDQTRNVATFDIAYLGNAAAAAWSSGGSYSVGNLVSSSDATVYGGTVINYRWVNGTSQDSAGVNVVACSGNPKPGLHDATNGPNSRACWEWASLYDIRQAVAAGTQYSGQGVIAALLGWVKAGMSPTAQALHNAGSDGTDIGAVAVTAPLAAAANASYAGRWLATTGDVSLSGVGTTATIQQPATNGADIAIDQIVVYCSSLCVASQAANGSAATSTTGTVIPILPNPLSAASSANFFTASNVGAGTAQGSIQRIPAGATYVWCLSRSCGASSDMVIGRGGGTASNYSVSIGSFTGVANVTFYLRSLQ